MEFYPLPQDEISIVNFTFILFFSGIQFVGLKNVLRSRSTFSFSALFECSHLMILDVFSKTWISVTIGPVAFMSSTKGQSFVENYAVTRALRQALPMAYYFIPNSCYFGCNDFFSR